MNRFLIADVVVDADNVAAWRPLVVRAVFRDVEAQESELRYVHVVGRSPSVLEEYAELFGARFPHAIISVARSSSLKNSADVLAAVWLGQVSVQMDPADRDYQVYVLSRDRLIIGAARTALAGKARIVLPEDAARSGVRPDGDPFRTILLPTSASRRDEPGPVSTMIPDWALAECVPHDHVGLYWVGGSALPPDQTPGFVPFPHRQQTVLVGGADGEVDVDLSAWDTPGVRRRSLYSPHVEFRYLPAPDSTWTVRSMRGHRSGRRKTTIDGKLRSASVGAQAVHTGTALGIGRFSFAFQDNRVLNHTWLEDPKGMLERLERGFRRLAEQAPIEAIPEAVRSDLCLDGASSWQNAFLRHYSQLFVALWGCSVVSWLDRTFPSRTAVRRELGSLVRLRNLAFHPSRPTLSDSDKGKLASLYCRYTEDALDWPA